MMRTLPFVMFFLLLVPTIFGQDNTAFDYSPIEMSGDLPSMLGESFSTRFNDVWPVVQKQAAKDTVKVPIKDLRTFYLNSSYALTKLAQSGDLYYNDALTAYVNDLADRLFADEPETRERLSFHVVRSTSVNALAMNDGSIFVTLGMLAKLDSEAELAFILCHEASHVLKRHLIMGLNFDAGIVQNKRKIKELSPQGMLLKRSNFSQNQELDADLTGYQMYCSKGLPSAAASDALEKLRTSETPFTFEDATFNGSALLKEAWIDSTLTPEVLKAWSPEVEAYASMLPGADSLVVVDSFDATADSMEEEIEALYSSHPSIGSRIKQINSAEGLDCDASFALREDAFLNIRKTARYELLGAFSDKRYFVEALYCADQLIQEYGPCAYIEDQLSHALYQMTKIHLAGDMTFEWIEPMDFSPEIRPWAVFLDLIETEVLAEMGLTTLDSFEKEELKENLEASWKQHEYYPEEAADLEEASTTEEIEVNTSVELSEGDKVIVLDPLFMSLNLRSGAAKGLLEQEHEDKKWHNLVDDILERMDLDPVTISSVDIDAHSPDYFRKLVELRKYCSQMIINSDLETDILAYNREKVREICQDLGTSKIIFPGGFKFIVDKSDLQATVAYYTLLTVYLFPVGLLYYCLPNYQSYTYMMAMDADTGEFEYFFQDLSCKGTRGALGTMMYDNLNRMINR